MYTAPLYPEHLGIDFQRFPLLHPFAACFGLTHNHSYNER